MKSHVKILLLASIALFISETAFSQSFLDRVKQKAKDKIENRLDEKVDNEIDKGLDKVENSIDSLGNTKSGADEEISREAAMQNRMNSMLKGMGMSGDPVPIENNYSFNKLVQMHIEMYDSEENKTSNGDFITHLSRDNGSMAYEVISKDYGDNDQGLFIIDSKNKAMILLNNKGDEKTGVVYGLGTFFEDIENIESDDQHSGEDIYDVEFQHPDIKKTGKTKSIAGYKCQQYLYNTDDVDSEFWITDELKTSDRDFFSTLFKTSAMTYGMGYGYVMESTSKDKATGNTSKMQVTKVDNNASSTFNLSNYQITNLGTFQMPSQTED